MVALTVVIAVRLAWLAHPWPPLGQVLAARASRHERGVYLAVIAVLTVCLIAVVGQSYRSSHQYAQRIATLR